MLGVGAEALTFADGHVVASGGRRVSLARVGYEAHTNPISVARGIRLPLEATRSFEPSNVRVVPDETGRIATYSSFPYSVHAVALELDRPTGAVRVLDYAVVHDCGVMVNPTLVTGQLRGAVVMGLGAALWEELTYGPSGAPLSRRFKEYLLPRAPDLPRIRIGHRSTPSPHHPLGLKGAGESGVGGAMAAAMNAVADALGSDGRRLTRCPATAPAVLGILAGGVE